MMSQAIEKKLETQPIEEAVVLKSYKLMCTARAMSDLYEENAAVTAKYVHACSRGHEAVQKIGRAHV